jgi:hypothetical protein
MPSGKNEQHNANAENGNEVDDDNRDRGPRSFCSHIGPPGSVDGDVVARVAAAMTKLGDRNQPPSASSSRSDQNRSRRVHASFQKAKSALLDRFSARFARLKQSSAMMCRMFPRLSAEDWETSRRADFPFPA